MEGNFEKNGERRLIRKDAADYLTNIGFPTTPAMLAKMACKGGGPEFVRFRKRPVYPISKLIEWAEQELEMSSVVGGTK